MRVLHIDKFLGSPNLPSGGVNRYIEQVSQFARDRGHDVLTFGCDESGDGPFPLARDFTAPEHRRAFWRLLENPQAAKKLDAFLAANPVDVAHLHNLYHHLTTSVLPVLARRGVPCVMTVHDLRQLCGERVFWRWDADRLAARPRDDYIAEARKYCTGPAGLMLRMRKAYEHLTRRYHRVVKLFLCPSDFVRREVIAAGVDPAKVWLMRNPVDIPNEGRYPISPAEAVSENRVTSLLWFGRLAAEKSPEVALAAAKALPQVKLVFAGDGPREEPLRRRVHAEGLANVDMLGRVSRETLAELLDCAAAVLLTSRCNENSPAAMLEAMAAGKCVIGPDQPAIREWITDGQTGRLFPTGDGETLAKVAADVLEEPAAAKTAGLAARELIIQRHDPAPLAEELMAVYESLMG